MQSVDMAKDESKKKLTAIVVDPRLHVRAKIAAAEMGIPLRYWVEDALDYYLRAGSPMRAAGAVRSAIMESSPAAAGMACSPE